MAPLRYNLDSMIRKLNCPTALRTHVGRTLRWLPWLVVALACTWILWPNPITASRLAFQSVIIYDESPLPEAPPPEEYFPPEQPVPEPPPPAAEPGFPDEPAPPAAESDFPAEPAPPEAPPVDNYPYDAPPPAEQPGALEPLPEPPAEPATEAPRVPTRPAPPGLLIDQPPARAAQPQEAPPEVPAAPGASQSVINWSKFWDTVVVVVAYPWLCCGILLLLGVPLGLLLLEIKGQRRPRQLPETPGRRPPPPGRNPEL